MKATLRRGLLVAGTPIAAVALVSAGCSSDYSTSEAAPVASEITVDDTHHAASVDAAEQLRADMRKLWEDHVTWTRLYIVSAVAGLPDSEVTANRLLQNQADIGNAVSVYYGDEAGAQLTELLREHILIAADLVGAAKAGDTAAVETHRAAWYANGDEVADFLAGANPAWPAEDLRQMMRTHLDQTLDEATARLQQDWEADVAAYDRIHDHILQMADTLTAGIVEQFPERFQD